MHSSNLLSRLSGPRVDVSQLQGPQFLAESHVDFPRIRSAFAIALHMHQPLIPAGPGDLAQADLIGHLDWMFAHPEGQDNHNAGAFLRCYERTAGFVTDLVDAGFEPRVMLDYSGCLLFALEQGGHGHVLDALVQATTSPQTRRCIEWLGTPWGHAVAPSTPPKDYRLHVDAWRSHFASLFGADALARVTGFSPAEMALPNHPDVAYEFVRTLRDTGFRWVLVQEHTVESPDGNSVLRPAVHLPHRLVVRNAHGDQASIIALIKTQGSDTKLVGQMQPYYEARGLSRLQLAGKSIPPIVSQVADGENGGVMMNEFPDAFLKATREASGSETAPMNVGEYLEHLEALGLTEQDFPEVQPILQHRIWQRMAPGDGPERLQTVLDALRGEDPRFHVEGGSWTNDRSWIKGYEGVLGPIQEASARFSERIRTADDPRYRQALLLLLASQTSCYRYWGEGRWTDYGRELCRRLLEIAG